MQYLFVIAFIATYLLGDLSLGYTSSSPLYTHFTYMFQHAGVLHLILNSLTFIGYYRVVSKHMRYTALVILLIGFYSSFFSEHTLPTVGASSMVYAMIGMFLGMLAFNNYSMRNKAVFLLCIVLMLTISFFNPGSNFMVHSVSLSCGVYAYVLNLFFKRALNKS